MPLDNPNGKRLVTEAKKKKKTLTWTSIKNLKKRDSKDMQEFAKELAEKEHNCERCYLDVYWWRMNKKSD